MDLAAILAMLRRRFFPLLLLVIVGALGGYYRGHSAPKLYQATSRVLVSQPTPERGVQESLAAAQLSSSFIETYAKVAGSTSVAGKVVTQLGLPETPEQLVGKMTAAVEPNTFLIDITATDQDPVRATSLADAMAVALGERVAELEAGKTNPVTAKLLDRASPPGVPVSPHPRSDLALGLILGAVAGVALITALEALDRTIKTTAQGDAVFGASMVGLVPRRRSGQDLVVADAPDVDSEAYRALRTSVQFAQTDAVIRTVLVTSASPGDGKTTTAANLALALAASGENVVIVDADLRRAALAGVFGLEQAVGLSSLILRTAELSACLQPWADNVTVLTSGMPLPPNPSEVLGSNFMSHLLATLAAAFDIVIVDTPPVLPVTDAVALSTQVDAVLLVARYGATHRGPAAEARRRLDAVGANVIGYVLNAVPPRDGAGYYANYSYKRS